MIRIRFFGPRELNQKGFRAARYLAVGSLFHKVQRGTNISWIGAQIDIAPDRVVISVLETKMHDFLTLVEETMKTNVVAIRNVRKLAGKANHFVSILYVWRAFLSELWGALRCPHTAASGLNRSSRHSSGFVPFAEDARTTPINILCFITQQRGPNSENCGRRTGLRDRSILES